MKWDVMRTKHLTYSYVTLTNNKLVLIVSTKYWHATRARAFLNQVPSIISDAGHPVTFFSCWLRNYGPALAHHTIILLSTWILLLFFFYGRSRSGQSFVSGRFRPPAVLSREKKYRIFYMGINPCMIMKQCLIHS